MFTRWWLCAGEKEVTSVFLQKLRVWVSELAPSAPRRAMACIFFVFQGLNICTGWVDQMTKCGGLMCCAAEQDDKWTSRLGDNRALFISVIFKSEEKTEYFRPKFVVEVGEINFWCFFLKLGIHFSSVALQSSTICEPSQPGWNFSKGYPSVLKS